MARNCLSRLNRSDLGLPAGMASRSGTALSPEAPPPVRIKPGGRFDLQFADQEEQLE
jgi:hypothetical protein